jgi:hypothetical protein
LRVVERGDQGLGRERNVGIADQRVEVDHPAQVELGQSVADDDVAVEGRIVQLLGQAADEARKHIFPDGTDREISQRHGAAP